MKDNQYKSKELEKNKKKRYTTIELLFMTGKKSLAIQELKRYLEDYPNNSYGLQLYSVWQRHENHPENGIRVLEEYIKIETPVHIKKELAICYNEIGRFEDAYEIMKDVQIPSPAENSRRIYMDILSHLNKPWKEEEFQTLSYIENQIFKYSKKNAIRHINKHIDVDNVKEAEYGFSLFNNEINIVELFNEVEEIIQSKKAKRIITFDYPNSYIFKKDNVGLIREEESTNYFKVITIPTTNKILTMYPCYRKNYTDIYDLNKNIENTYSGKKTRILSQTEKFNLRYNK